VVVEEEHAMLVAEAPVACHLEENQFIIIK
jgi:hypothetical protein